MNPSLGHYFKTIQRTLDKKIFFIAGTEKSGTTWLQMLFDQHPHAVCKGEGQFGTRLWPGLRRTLEEYSGFIGELNNKVFSEIDQFPTFNERSIRAVQTFSAALLLSEYDTDERIQAVGEKTPGHLRTLERLKTLFPNAKFIFIVRDGRDIAISGWYHLKRQYGDDKADPLPHYARRIAHVWRNDYEKALAFSERHPNDCSFVSYEDLHRDAAPEMTRLFGFLGLDASPDIVLRSIENCHFSKLAGGRNRGEENIQSHFRKGVVGDWRSHFDYDTWNAFDTEAGELLSRLGYSRNWDKLSVDGGLDTHPSSENHAANKNIVSTPPEEPAEPLLDNTERMALAKKLAEQYDWHGVIATIERVHTAGGASFSSWYQLGNALRAIKDSEGATEAFRRALVVAPMHKEAQLMYAITLREANLDDAAVEAYRQLLKDHPADANGWRLYGMLLKNIKRPEEAITALRKSLELQADIPTHNALILTLVQAEHSDQAIAEGRRLLELKDAEAVKSFQSSVFNTTRITPVAKTFDYSKPHRNIISFSLWGDDPAYVHGAIVNAQIAPNLYYGWRTRFYCDKSVPADAINELQRLGAEIVMVEDPELQKIRPLWRFLVSDDPNVDWFMCRDTDSRLNAQELLAVEEWVRSGKSFHIMRDHIYHMELILAGMWGGMAGVLPNLRTMILNDPKYTNNRFSDQQFLMELVWPLIKGHVLIHDSYYRFAGSKEFPPGYRLPRPIHVGGAIKNMPRWNKSG